MTATSFDGSARALGSRAWRALHLTGGYYLLFQFTVSFGKRIPDPVYGGAGLISRLSLGLWKADPLHNRLDTQMLTQHCRVHQALMEGLQPIWSEWYQGGVS